MTSWSRPGRIRQRVIEVLHCTIWPVRRRGSQEIRGTSDRGRRGGWLLSFVLATGCATHPPELIFPPLTITDPAFKQSLEVYTGAPISGENKVDILLNGDETFPVLLKELRSAQRSITFEAFIFRESKIGEEIVTAFEDRCRAGVRASILLDAHGSADIPDQYVERMDRAGCHVVSTFRRLAPWNIRRSNNRNHRRIVVIDGRIGFSGGYGIDEAWNGDGRTPGRWRETNVRLEGPIVQQLQEAFIEHWKEATGILLGGEDYLAYPAVTIGDAPVQAQIIRSSPTRDNYALYEVFMQSIMSARRSILISTPYLLPGKHMITALADAVKRGVQVRALVPSVTHEAWIEYVVQESQREGFGSLLDAGMELYEYTPALLHTKAVVVDGIWSTIGSMNFDNRSMALNDELNVIFYNEQIARRLKDILEEDLTHSKRISREQLEDRSWAGRLVGFMMSPITDQF